MIELGIPDNIAGRVFAIAGGPFWGMISDKIGSQWTLIAALLLCYRRRYYSSYVSQRSEFYRIGCHLGIIHRGNSCFNLSKGISSGSSKVYFSGNWLYLCLLCCRTNVRTWACRMDD